RLGAATLPLESRLPFSLEPKIPTEVTRSDKITVPLAIDNSTSKNRSVDVQLETNGLTVVGDARKQLAVDAGKRVRQLFYFQAAPQMVEGEAQLTFAAHCEPFGVDRVRRNFKVVPEGFPASGKFSDVLEGTASHDVVLPEHWVKGTLKCSVQVFPSTLADLQKGLEALLREPGGCFEQSSTSNYPNVLILDYLKTSEQSRPDVEKRARQLLDSGYQRLTGFECLAPNEQMKRRGYEWFGGAAPPHEALTAYGLLQFRDM